MKLLRSIANWLEDRTGLWQMIRPMLLHPVPPKTGWSYIFGSATLLAFMIQVVTGIALATIYIPSSGQAYQSLQYITEQAPFGHFLRGAHFFGASAMVLLVGLHAIRIFLTGSYKFPREMNWISGTILLFATLGMGFTGQILRWDQNALWSLVVGAEQAGRTPLIGSQIGHFLLGGPNVGADTLSRFFALHVFVLPGLLLMVVGLHLYLVLRNGISEPPERNRPVDPASYRQWYQELLSNSGEPFWPAAVWRDAVFGVLVIIAIISLAFAVGPPDIGVPPDPSLLHAQPRPDWYFMWYFAVLALLPHGLENYVILLAPLLGFLVLLLLPLVANSGDRHPLNRPWALCSLLLILSAMGALWLAGLQADWSPDFNAKPLSATVIGTSSGPVARGGLAFSKRGCLYCHTISDQGGRRGPNLTTVGNRLTAQQMTIRILNGGYNMPAYGGILKAKDVEDLVAFLQSRQ
ncbi:cytochrome b N-terminal domain-containing protein [Pelobacter seleniigenes]|uniref:cytochrome b N-terminal domain-containing protein n=1 Tax=Pelobacter seleniigenes TaxID=407188 RepID=UPI0004A717FA|nr:cytochrome b N-terminal domain-containing protein [Pelobacter seleniigenes]